MSSQETPKEIVRNLMIAVVPERGDEFVCLWDKYNPNVELVSDAKRFTLNANRDRIQLDTKIMDIFWLICFGGWRAIECYSPHVVCSISSQKNISTLLKVDDDLSEVERAYKERRAAAQTFIEAEDIQNAPWPPDLPKSNANRDAFDDDQYKSAFDLTCLAIGFAMFHEFRHVMLDKEDIRPADLREEELTCDVWAREFITAKLESYARANGHRFEEVLRKRSMGFAIAALVLHEITPFWERGGNSSYFSVATRMEAILNSTPLPCDDHFWVFTASLLIGIYRQKGAALDFFEPNAKLLTERLIDGL